MRSTSRRARQPTARSALPSRLPGLDVLRAVAATTVALSHLLRVLTLGSPDAAKLAPRAWDDLNVGFYALGAWAVSLFFVVSGLCIHLPMARRLASDPSSALEVRPYLWRRFRRIYPPHLVALIASIAVAALLPAALSTEARLISVPTWPQLALHLLLAHTFSPAAFNSANRVFWTIAVESQFYLLYPLLLLWRRRWPWSRIALALLALSLAMAGTSAELIPSLGWVVRATFAARIWEWVLGCWIAERLVAQGKPSPTGRAPLFAALVLTLGATFAAYFFQAGVIAINWVGPLLMAGVVILSSSLTIRQKSWLDRALLAVGLRSYSLYLTHAIAITGIAGLILTSDLSWRWRAALEILGSALLCAIFFRAVEQPFLKFIKPVAATDGRVEAAPAAPRH